MCAPLCAKLLPNRFVDYLGICCHGYQVDDIAWSYVQVFWPFNFELGRNKFTDREAVFIESSLRPIKKLAITREVWQYRKEDYDNLKKELNDYYND
jgi:hypothetical protein